MGGGSSRLASFFLQSIARTLGTDPCAVQQPPNGWELKAKVEKGDLAKKLCLATDRAVSSRGLVFIGCDEAAAPDGPTSLARPGWQLSVVHARRSLPQHGRLGAWPGSAAWPAEAAPAAGLCWPF